MPSSLSPSPARTRAPSRNPKPSAPLTSARRPPLCPDGCRLRPLVAAFSPPTSSRLALHRRSSPRPRCRRLRPLVDSRLALHRYHRHQASPESRPLAGHHAATGHPPRGPPPPQDRVVLCPGSGCTPPVSVPGQGPSSPSPVRQIFGSVISGIVSFT
ncbi:hypothetical protein GUJ93_ZPchr0004g38716 [Zizania palustris]|uniref:Uncharacterized protein n=1 Tax=Zizania palustris TaxID=103762 RepID=A0A8J5SKR8_ZIZPA|nr:hypothetical protein GUJ93_ZPchr0004g38716 [Zizania palustris]